MLFSLKSRADLQREIAEEVKAELFKQKGVASPGRTMPSIVQGLVYNEDNISLQTYKKMENDAGVIAPLTIVKAPIHSVEWDIECENSDIREFVKKALKRIWNKFVSDSLLALNFGFQAFEKIFERNGDGIVYKKLLPFDPEYITLKEEKDGSFGGIELQMFEGENVQLPPEKSFVFTHDKRWDNDYGRSRLRPAYRYWFIDRYYYDFENVFMETLSCPPTIGYAPPGKTKTEDGREVDNLETMLQTVKDIRSGGSAALPSNMWSEKDRQWFVELLESKKDVGHFIKAHEHLDTMKARAIFVPDLIFQAQKVGSYALGKQHSNNFILSIKAILDTLKEYIDLYLIPQLVLYNFGSNAPRAEWNYSQLSESIIDLLKEIFIQATKIGTAPPIDWEWAFNILGIPVPPQLQEKEKESKEEGGQEPSESEMQNSYKINPQTGRPLTIWEQRIDFQALEKDWDNIDNKIISYMEDYIEKTKEDIISQYERQMEAGKIKAEDIKAKKEATYKRTLINFMLEAIQVGIDSVKAELQIDKDFPISNRTRNWVNSFINSLAAKQIEDLKFQVSSGIEDTLQMNAESYDKSTISEAVKKAEDNYNTWVNKNIKINARTITSKGINQGRSIVAFNYKK